MIEGITQVRVAVLATILLAHGTRAGAQRLAFTPDGRTLASEGGADVNRLDKLERALDALDAALARRFERLEQRLDAELRRGAGERGHNFIPKDAKPLVGQIDMNREGGPTAMPPADVARRPEPSGSGPRAGGGPTAMPPAGIAFPDAVEGARDAGPNRQLSPSDRLEISARGFLPPSAGGPGAQAREPGPEARNDLVARGYLPPSAANPRDRARAAASDGSRSAATADESAGARLERLEQRLLRLDASLSKKFEDLEKLMAPFPAQTGLSR